MNRRSRIPTGASRKSSSSASWSTSKSKSATRNTLTPGSGPCSLQTPLTSRNTLQTLNIKSNANLISRYSGVSLLTTPAGRASSTPNRQALLEKLPNLNDFLRSQGLIVSNIKSPTITDFVSVIQLLTNIICESSRPPITMKNYKVEVPRILKDLDYPVNIQPSLLKCPNLPHSYPHVLQMWLFLYDIAYSIVSVADPFSEDDITDPEQQLVIKLLGLEISNEEYEEQLYMIKGIDQNEVAEMQDEEDRLRAKSREHEKKNEKAVERYEHLQANYSQLKQESEQYDHELAIVKSENEKLFKSIEDVEKTKIQIEKEYEVINARRQEKANELEALNFHEDNLDQQFNEIEFEKKMLKLMKERCENLRANRKDQQLRNQNLQHEIKLIIFELESNRLSDNDFPKHLTDHVHGDMEVLLNLSAPEVSAKIEILRDFNGKVLGEIERKEKLIAKHEREIRKLNEEHSELVANIEKENSKVSTLKNKAEKFDDEFKRLLKLRQELFQKCSVLLKAKNPALEKLELYRSQAKEAVENHRRLQQETIDMEQKHKKRLLRRKLKANLDHIEALDAQTKALKDLSAKIPSMSKHD